jgi:hypothetical protein
MGSMNVSKDIPFFLSKSNESSYASNARQERLGVPQYRSCIFNSKVPLFDYSCIQLESTMTDR